MKARFLNMLRRLSNNSLVTGNLTVLIAEGQCPVKVTQHCDQGTYPSSNCLCSYPVNVCPSSTLHHKKYHEGRENSFWSYCFPQFQAQELCRVFVNERGPLSIHSGHVILGEAHSGGRLLRRAVHLATLFLHHMGLLKGLCCR